MGARETLASFVVGPRGDEQQRHHLTNGGGPVSPRDCKHTWSHQLRHSTEDLPRTVRPSGYRGQTGAALSESSGSKLRSTTSNGRSLGQTRATQSIAATIMPWSLLLLSLLFLSSTVSATVTSSSLSPNDPLVTHLFDLCRVDALCAIKWYLPTPPPVSPPRPFDKAQFARLLSIFALVRLHSPDGTLVTVTVYEDFPDLVSAGLANATIQAALDALQDARWLELLQTAEFCGGLPNRVFQLGKGCICAPGSDCSTDGSTRVSTFETIAYGILVFMLAAMILHGFWQNRDDSNANRRMLDNVEQMLRTMLSNGGLNISLFHTSPGSVPSTVASSGAIGSHMIHVGIIQESVEDWLAKQK